VSIQTVKYYDFIKAQEIIENHTETLTSAHLGMFEDWLWTAEPVFEDGQFTKYLLTTEKIAGIDGSCWATPTLLLEFKDRPPEFISCFYEKEVIK